MGKCNGAIVGAISEVGNKLYGIIFMGCQQGQPIILIKHLKGLQYMIKCGLWLKATVEKA